jgi:hypothetical protein
VPFSLGFQIYPWVERALRVRQYPLAAYGLALILARDVRLALSAGQPTWISRVRSPKSGLPDFGY